MPTFQRWKSGSLADPSEPCGRGGRKCPMPPPMPVQSKINHVKLPKGQACAVWCS